MNFVADGDACRDVTFLLRREWLETNGLGGYASGTLLTSHSRRYHGLLVADLPAPLNGRHVLLSTFAESVLIGGHETHLTRHHFPGGLQPHDAAPLTRFECRDFPTWTYVVDGVQVRRSVMMLPGRNAVLLRYRTHAAARLVRLRLKPFLAFRRNHALIRENLNVNPDVQPIANGCRMMPYSGMPPLFLHWAATAKATLAALNVWYRKFEYPEEQRRGYDFREDLFAPCVLELSLPPGTDLFVAASTEDLTHLDLLWRQETRRRQQARNRHVARCHTLTSAGADASLVAELMTAAGQFLTITPTGRSALLAGYHWFEDWGRDTMISLPGIAFCTGRQAEGLAVLDAFLQREENGFLPNYLNPDGTAAYNSVDASLWFFWTVQQFLFCAGGDIETVREHCWPAMRRILAAYAAGRDSLPLRMNADGLLHAGSPQTQLTWMDAHVDGRPVTPRWGYAVEINALWYNAVAFAVELAQRLGDTQFRPPVDTASLAAAFRRLFWLPSEQFLADVINETGVDTALRPNQIFAVSLPCSPLLPEQQVAVVDRVQRQLLTPCGLRTLAPTHPDYRSRYGGDVRQRDFAYHQGTVWPWLLGAFIEAYLRTRPASPAVTAQVRHWLHAWQEHLAEAGLGTISEVFDGDPPHAPNGCIAQAWSVAEIIRSHLLLWQAAARESGQQTAHQ